MADIYSYSGNLKKAAIYYDSAFISLNNDLELNNSDYSVHGFLGHACAGLKIKDKAIEEGRKAVEMIEYENFDKSDMILNLAKILTMTGEFEEAANTIDFLIRTPVAMPSCLSLSLLNIDPVWNPLINSPEFKAWQRKTTIN